MSISMDEVKNLRDETGLPIMKCKKALEEAEGDVEKAKNLLKKESGKSAEKKAERELKSGVVEAYVHNSKDIAALVALSCETDFVARNEEFVALAYDIAMQVAAVSPEYLRKSEISKEDREKAIEMFKGEVEDKPEELKEKILEGKLDSYFKDKVLEEQEFIKDSSMKVSDLINSATQKFGERIEISTFKRLSIR